MNQFKYTWMKFNQARNFPKAWEYRNKATSLNAFNRTYYSQNGEDGILEFIFDRIGITKNGNFLEVGAGDGEECNSRRLLDFEWKGFQIDAGYKEKGIRKKEFVTAENIENLIVKYQVPKDLDFLSIDVDGNDYWVWKSIKSINPKIVCIEYNSIIPQDKPMVQKYNPENKWDGTDQFGANLLALINLGKQKGYICLGTDGMGINTFFARKDIGKLYFKKFLNKSFEELYNFPKFKLHPRGNREDAFMVVE